MGDVYALVTAGGNNGKFRVAKLLVPKQPHAGGRLVRLVLDLAVRMDGQPILVAGDDCPD